MFGMRLRNLCHCRHGLSGYETSSQNLVSSNVAHGGQKSGMSALTLQRDLGLGSYKTAWSMLHKMRLAMVRPGRERLSGNVEVDETYWEQQKAQGRLDDSPSAKALSR